MKEAVKSGGAAAHKFSKRFEKGTADPCNSEGVPLEQEDALQKIVEPFERLWADPERLRDEPWTWDIEGHSLPPIKETDLDDAILAKKLGAALGWENLPPRLLLKVPRKTKLALIDLMQQWANTDLSGGLKSFFGWNIYISPEY